MKKKAKLDKVLKKLMKEKGVSATELSKATGIPPATLSSLTSGGQSQKPEHLLALSQYFGSSIESLLFGEDMRPPTLDEVLTEGIFEGWLKVRIDKAVPNKRKVDIEDE